MTEKVSAVSGELPPAVLDLRASVGDASQFLKKLANPDRLLVVCALVDNELSVRQIEDLLGIRQPGLSQQLAELRTAGLIEGRKEGREVFYRLADARVRTIVETLHTLFCSGASENREGSREP
ncbi:ArsR/SmtB family transcription factor [Pseudochelatococcus contaminans]|uniref:DNA-binding transcriptional ArsR family regulator n=1 Tax=Pseudochelatococcus contaminans TaxID=1538103 RepID=A0A7W5Z392_9HYPH|nr:metalloregulator ArsR/SmtB family transcription factor [Pseudochelatococcus contaminans]MBB3809189.1 DNA-binding transcriptional ArsR family regulator [Pseudochelatococcus contaminans]